MNCKKALSVNLRSTLFGVGDYKVFLAKANTADNSGRRSAVRLVTDLNRFAITLSADANDARLRDDACAASVPARVLLYAPCLRLSFPQLRFACGFRRGAGEYCRC